MSGDRVTRDELERALAMSDEERDAWFDANSHRPANGRDMAYFFRRLAEMGAAEAGSRSGHAASKEGSDHR